MAKRVLILLVAAVALVAVLWFSQQGTEDLKVSGFVEADEIRIGSRVGGRVKSVRVEEGQRVTQGDLLIELEPFDLRERLAEAQARRAQSQAKLDELMAGFRREEIAQAKAQVDQLRANLEKLQHGPRAQEIRAAEAEVELAESEMELAQIRHRRVESLLAQNAVSREEYDSAVTALQVTRSRANVKENALALLKEGTRQEDLQQAAAMLAQAEHAWALKQNGYRPEEIAEATAAVEAAAAAEKVIQRQLDELQIVAPVEGTVEAVELQPGDLVAANAPVISIMDTSHLWIRAYVPESGLHLQVGDEVIVNVISYPDEEFRGRITFVARQAEFTPGNVQTPEDRSKQVFRIKVTLLGGLDRLRPGMSADVWLSGEPADG